MLDSISSKMVTFKLDGKDIEVPEGTTIWAASKEQGTLIPHLCAIKLKRVIVQMEIVALVWLKLRGTGACCLMRSIRSKWYGG